MRRAGHTTSRHHCCHWKGITGTVWVDPICLCWIRTHKIWNGSGSSSDLDKRTRIWNTGFISVLRSRSSPNLVGAVVGSGSSDFQSRSRQNKWRLLLHLFGKQKKSLVLVSFLLSKRWSRSRLCSGKQINLRLRNTDISLGFLKLCTRCNGALAFICF